ncbi:MAG: DUF2155 domain-containing protein [Phenylobacterium sp.]|uniref:DUF2155 domain-containing protein n=1 Tax=Phenylobacterium sp. TaxID=1871053 RepID=UPI002719B909|nr:DUF2155 domain-containing protein [Phenylobacterium sp.]MDO8901309.1 DUF2155 domain-containing protein [Phenylobacterium sp.]MDP2213555.1 DUF2155 domain-containing protein [Phenylobacterium sp.]
MRPARLIVVGLSAAGLVAGGAVLAQTAPEAPAAAAPVAPPPAAQAELPMQLPPPEPVPDLEPEPPRPRAAQPPEPPSEPKPPMKRARYGVAIIQALDKVSAETIRFEAPVGQPIRYKSLVFTVRACELAAPDERAPDAMAYMTIDSQPRPVAGRPTPPPRQTFRGWMYAGAPGLNPLEHPVYDAWLITCRAETPPKAG